VGLVPLGTAAHRDVTITDDSWRPLTPGDDAIGYLRVVQVGCSCGWRSERVDAPIGTGWRQATVHVSEWFERECRLIWRTHAIVTTAAKEEAAKRA